MEISSSSIREFLQSIAHAVSQNDTTCYDDLLRIVFEDNFLAPAQFLRSGDKFASEIFLGRDDVKRILLFKLIWEEFGYPSGNQSDRSPSALPAEEPRRTLINNALTAKEGRDRVLPPVIGEEVKDRTEAGTGTHCSVVKIAGCSGIGKTTLARVVYEERSVEKHFDLRVWVQLEERELDLRNAARGILRSAMGMPCAVDELDELDEMVRDIFQGQRCLIVIDGIGAVSEDSWLHMKQCWFDFVDLGSKVLITTTTSGDVECLLPSHEIELPPLIPSNASSLFSCIAFGALEIGNEKNMMWCMAENLAPACGGIPLLLKLLGSLLRYDDRIADLLSYVDFLPSIWNESSAVLLCVWCLPPKLRQCLAYCALFPKGYALNRERMIYMWSANGVSDLGDADTCFHHLLSRAFFTEVTRDENNNVIEFRIPSLIHGILEDVARVIYKEKLGSLGLIGLVDEDAARISLAGGYEVDHLRVLILSPTLYIGGGLDRPLVDFRELTSLDLSCSGIHSLSDDICALKKLKYLNLSYTLVERLPDSVTDLSLLQTLDLSWCYHLRLLPSTLRDLTLMSHLDLSQCETLSHFPSGISSLISLSSMPLFVLGKDRDSAGLQELGSLNQLKRKLEIRNLENVKETVEAQDARLAEKRLQHLELSWSQSGDYFVDLCFDVLQLLQPNQQLEVLGLRGYRDLEFPEWISSMKNLVKISITDCGCDKLPSLGELPLLKELQLRGMAKLKYIGPEFYAKAIADVVFQSLERLEVYDLPSLLEWSGDERAFLSLKFVTIEDCPQLHRLPSIPSLHDLIVSKSNWRISRSVPNCTSLLIKGTEVWDFGYLHIFGVLKKLIFCNIPDKYLDPFHQMEGEMLPALEHLGILHCNELIDVSLKGFSSLKKLHIVDCPKLRFIFMEEKDALLMEMVVEDCPQARAVIYFHDLHSLRKLIVRNCNDRFPNFGAQYQMMEKLQYLSISGCQGIERELQAYPDLISYIPVVIVGNHKAKFDGMSRGIKSISPPLPMTQPVSSPILSLGKKAFLKNESLGKEASLVEQRLVEKASLRKQSLEEEASLKQQSLEEEASLGKIELGERGSSGKRGSVKRKLLGLLLERMRALRGK